MENKKKDSLQIIGRILKENRIRKNLTIHEISVVTKINSRIIKSIEEGNLAELPSKSFLRGFVRSYASYLKIDVDEILRTFQKELGSTLYEPSSPKTSKADRESLEEDLSSFQKKPKKKPKKQSSFFSLFFWGLALCLTIYFVLTIRALVEKYKQESLVNLSPKALKKIERIEKKEMETNEREEQKKEEKFEDNIKPKKVEESVKSLKSDIRGEDKKENMRSSTEKKENLSPSSRPGNLFPLSHQVVLEPSKDVKIHLTFTKDNQKQQKILNLIKDQTHIIKFPDSIEILFPEGGVTKIYHNGKEKGLLGKEGVSFQVKYP